MNHSEFLFHCHQLVDAFTMGIINEQDFDHAIAILCAMNPHHAHKAANDCATDLIFADITHFREN